MACSADLASSPWATRRSNHLDPRRPVTSTGTPLRAVARSDIGGAHTRSSVTCRRGGYRSAPRAVCRSRTHTATRDVPECEGPVVGQPTARSDGPPVPEGQASSLTVRKGRDGRLPRSPLPGGRLFSTRSTQHDGHRVVPFVTGVLEHRLRVPPHRHRRCPGARPSGERRHDWSTPNPGSILAARFSPLIYRSLPHAIFFRRTRRVIIRNRFPEQHHAPGVVRRDVDDARQRVTVTIMSSAVNKAPSLATARSTYVPNPSKVA